MSKLWIVSCCFLVSSAFGVSKTSFRPPQKIEDSASQGVMPDHIFKRLQRAQLFLADEKFSDALALLERLEQSAGNRNFILAQIYQTRGFVYAQMSQYDPAIKALKASLALKALPLRATLQSMMTLAQLHMAKEQFGDAALLIQDVIYNSESPPARYYVALAQCFGAMKMPEKGLAPLRKAMAMQASPRKSWLSLYVALAYQAKRYSEASDALVRLIDLEPRNPKYWTQLSSLYMADGKDERAAGALESAYKFGLLQEEKDIVRLTSILFQAEIPYKAGKLLSEALKQGKVKATRKHYEMLATFWTQAQEFDQALSALGQAAPLAKTGQVFIRQGGLYLAKEDWQNAKQALLKGLQKGQLKNQGKAYLSLGIAQFKSGERDQAIQSFEKAKTQGEKKQADDWLAHIQQAG